MNVFEWLFVTIGSKSFECNLTSVWWYPQYVFFVNAWLLPEDHGYTMLIVMIENCWIVVLQKPLKPKDIEWSDQMSLSIVWGSFESSSIYLDSFFFESLKNNI